MSRYYDEDVVLRIASAAFTMGVEVTGKTLTFGPLVLDPLKLAQQHLKDVNEAFASDLPPIDMTIPMSISRTLLNLVAGYAKEVH